MVVVVVVVVVVVPWLFKENPNSSSNVTELFCPVIGIGVKVFSVISKAKFPSSELVTKLGNSVTSGLSLVANDKLISSSASDLVVRSIMLVVPLTSTEIENSSSGFPKLSPKVEGVGRSVVMGMVTATSGLVSSELALKLGISISFEPTISCTELSTSSKVSEAPFVAAIAVVLAMVSKSSPLKTSSSIGEICPLWSIGIRVVAEKEIVTISPF